MDRLRLDLHHRMQKKEWLNYKQAIMKNYIC